VRALTLIGQDAALLAQDAAPAGAEPAGGDFLSPFLLPAGLLFLFYFIVIAPERRRKSEEAKLMASLKKNDRVVTIGGIHAIVVAVAADNDVITLRIDENGNTRIKVNRSAIVRIVNEAPAISSESTKDDDSDAKK
jgi:preprotein translocase subunit YajC